MPHLGADLTRRLTWHMVPAMRHTRDSVAQMRSTRALTMYRELLSERSEREQLPRLILMIMKRH